MSRWIVWTAMSLLALALGVNVGCKKADDARTPIGVPAVDPGSVGGHDHEHDHAHEGPHKGQIIELGGEEYHGELVHDDAAGTVTVYILDGAAKSGVPVDAAEVTLNLVIDGTPQQFMLPAAPESGEPEGKSSRFELKDASLLEALEGDTSGRMSVTIDGTPYTGEIDHHEHDHAGHDHESEAGHEGEADHDHGDEAGHEHAEGEEGHAEEDHDHEHAEDEAGAADSEAP